jgi:hypothetical protein
MKYINKYLLALSVVVSVASFVSQASAQDSAGRDAAIGRCIRVAHLQYPNEEQTGRRLQGLHGCCRLSAVRPAVAATELAASNRKRLAPQIGTETRRLPTSSRSASRRLKIIGHRRFGN